MGSAVARRERRTNHALKPGRFGLCIEADRSDVIAAMCGERAWRSSTGPEVQLWATEANPTSKTVKNIRHSRLITETQSGTTIFPHNTKTWKDMTP